MPPVCPAKLRAALHKESLVVTKIVHDMVEASNRYAIKKIADGGSIDNHTNSETIIYGEARQPFKEYKEVDYLDKDLIEGEMTGVDCGGRSATFETDVNDIRDNACSGECIIDFGQGFRRRGFKDFDIKPKTNVICASELAGKGEAHVRAFFKGFVKSFSDWGFDNYDANLLNMVIRYGEANASVQSANYFGVTTGGFIAPPQNRISIHFLEKYRLHMVRAKGLSASGMLEVEMPRQDWIDAVRHHQLALNPNIQITTELFKDEEGPFRGRDFGVYGAIKCYFNEEPVKGYFKQVGVTGGGEKLYQFVRIYPWINTVGEEAGLLTRPNHAYDGTTYVCDGIKYDLCILAFVIHEKSFKRYGKNTDYKPGAPMAPNNYTVKVIDGDGLSHIPCGNDYNENFKLVARHQFRLEMPYPEWSGAIAYRASQPLAYVIPVCNEDDEVPTAATSTGPVFDTCMDGPLACQQAVCEECGLIADVDGQCIAAEAETDAVLVLEPCGTFITAYEGTTHQVVLRVRRTGTNREAIAATYTITDTPGAELATTPDHYVDVSDDPGNLAWAAGDGEDKLIKLNIVGASGDAAVNLGFTVQLVDGTNSTLHATCDDVTGTIEDHSV